MNIGNKFLDKYPVFWNPKIGDKVRYFRGNDIVVTGKIKQIFQITEFVKQPKMYCIITSDTGELEYYARIKDIRLYHEQQI